MGCILAVVGTDVLAKFFPAFAILVLLVPVPGAIQEFIGLPLQNGKHWDMMPTETLVPLVLQIFGELIF